MIILNDTQNLNISFKQEDIDFDKVFSFLKDSCWGKRYQQDLYQKALKNSYVISLFLDQKQIGFARLITDGEFFGYLADVFIIKDHQSKGYGKYMLDQFLNAPHVKKIKRITLSTNDSGAFYERFGFHPFRYPERQMEKLSHETCF